MAQAASHQLLPSAPCLLGAECLCTWGYNDTSVYTVHSEHSVHLGVDREPGDGGQLEVELGQQQREEGAGLLRALRHRHRHVAAGGE